MKNYYYEVFIEYHNERIKYDFNNRTDRMLLIYKLVYIFQQFEKGKDRSIGTCCYNEEIENIINKDLTNLIQIIFQNKYMKLANYRLNAKINTFKLWAM